MPSKIFLCLLDRNLGDGTEYIHLSHSVEILVPENLKGATYYDSNTILDSTNYYRPHKHLQDAI